jgi:hypothetical protein
MTPAAIRVYYNTAQPCALFPPPFAPTDFGVVALVENTDRDLNTADRVFNHLNADDRPGGQSVRSLSVGDVVEIDGRMQQCLEAGWREVADAEAEALRARFGIVSAPPAWGLADAMHRAYDMLEQAMNDLCETVDHPQPNVRGGYDWAVTARAVLAPYATAWQTATQAMPAVFRFTLQDGDALAEDRDAVATQEVLIFLSEDVEVVVPRPGQTPGFMDPAREEAVVRVELWDGEVRAKIWDQAAVREDADDSALILPLVPRRAPPIAEGMSDHADA